MYSSMYVVLEHAQANYVSLSFRPSPSFSILPSFRPSILPSYLLPTADTLGSLLGAPIFGWIYDAGHTSYEVSAFVTGGFLVLGVAALCFSPSRAAHQREVGRIERRFGVGGKAVSVGSTVTVGATTAKGTSTDGGVGGDTSSDVGGGLEGSTVELSIVSVPVALDVEAEAV